MNIAIDKKNLTIIGVSIIAITVVSFLIIYPTINYIKDIRERINKERSELEKQYQRVLYLKNNIKKLKEIEDKLSILDNLFLIEGEELKFITAIENAAAINNVEQAIDLKDINLDDSKQVNLPFNLSISGTTHNIISYLLALEQLDYYLNFNSLNIASKNINKQSSALIIKGATRSSNIIDVKLNGEIYLLKNP